MNTLNKQQKLAVEYKSGPLLIVAGAGTGKTTVITKKIEHLIMKKGVKPEEILALTFTEKAAGEMQERVDELLDVGYVDLQISTFHAFCQQILEHHGLDIGIPNQFKLFSQMDAWMLVRKHIHEFDLNYYRPIGNPARHVHELIKHFGKCKDELISPAEYLSFAEGLSVDERGGETATKKSEIRNQKSGSEEVGDVETERMKEVAGAYHKYNQLLLDNQAMDFADLMFYSVKLLRERPNILESLQKRFKYILVDEFQDVNWAQYELVRLLSHGGQLTVVGDDDQSIYAFRGASVSNILRFKEDYVGAKEIVLTENYRSGQEILDLAHESVKHNNPDRLEVKLGIDKALKSDSRNQITEITHLHRSTQDEEVRSVVQKIRELLSRKDVGLDDIALLVRANNHATPFLNALEQAGIPYEYVASSGLYRQPVVLDCLHFFRLLDNYHESTSVYRLLRMPFLGFSEQDMMIFTTQAKRYSVGYYEALGKASTFGLSTEGVHVCAQLQKLILEGVQQGKYEKPTAVLHHFLEKSGYFEYLVKTEQEGDRAAMRQIVHAKQLFDHIGSFEADQPGADIRSFIEHFEYIVESGDAGGMHSPKETEDSVNVMTIHGSKGLEFKHVFILNMVEDRFPSRRRGSGIEIPEALIKEQLPEGDAHMAEERRLFYVAMTRAREGLYFTSADSYEGNKRRKKISRFLSEIDILEKDSGADKKKLEIGNLKLGSRDRKSVDPSHSYVLPKVFSFSQIRTYQNDPYEYKLQYILKIPQKGSQYFSFGNSVHLTLQKFYQKVQLLNSATQDSLFGLPEVSSTTSNIKVPPLKDLLDLYKKNWISDWYKSKDQREEYFAKGKEALSAYYKKHDGNWTIPVALEGGFKIGLGKYTVRGNIDRIDQLADGSLHIIDYKTGKAKEKLATEDKDQLLLYQLAARQLPQYRNIGEVSKLTYYYVNEGVERSFVGKEKDLEKFETKIIDTLEQLHAEDWAKLTRDKVPMFGNLWDLV